MTMEAKAFDLKSTVIVLQPDQSATAVEVTPTLYDDLNKTFDDFRDRRLVSSFHFESDWNMWEMHPAGDEIVYALSGSYEFILEEGVTERVVEVPPRTAFIVPRGTWHRAVVREPGEMLFVTRGEGTQHRPR